MHHQLSYFASAEWSPRVIVDNTWPKVEPQYSFATVCSGIESVSCAWEPLGYRPIFFSEVAKFPSTLLAHRFPTVPNLGDMTKINGVE